MTIFKSLSEYDTAVLGVLIIGVFGLIVLLVAIISAMNEMKDQKKRNELYELQLKNEQARLVLEVMRQQYENTCLKHKNSSNANKELDNGR